ncbi:hypothetical protein MTO96_022372 [Rhipicephalus appendiculatus]
MSGVHKKVCPDEAFDSLEGYHALPVELRGVAEAELGETPAKRREALAAITQLLQAEPDLNANKDEEFLLRFLRVRQVQGGVGPADHQELLQEPGFERVPLPRLSALHCATGGSRDRHDTARQRRPRAAGVARETRQANYEGSWVTDEVSYLDLHRAGLFCLEHLARDPAAQVAGIALLVDYGGFTMDKLLYVSISLVRRGLQYMQLRLHGHNFENLHKEISPMALPEEYGGQRPPLDPEECWKAVDADKDYFVACSRYGYATNDEDDHPTEPEPQLEITSL